MAASLIPVFVAVSTILFIISSDRLHLGAASAGLPEGPLSYHVVEECPFGTFVADLKNDAGLMTSRPSEQLEFRLLTNSTFFDLDHSSGILRTSGRIDRDTLCPARDDCTLLADFVVKPIMYFRKVIIEIEDINDNSPKFPKNFVSNRIPESSVPGQLKLFVDCAFDPDSPLNGITGYHLELADDEHRPQPFRLVQRRGPSGDFDLRLELHLAVDRERQDFYQVKVIATDGGDIRRSGSVVIDIIIDDVNDNSPRFVNSTYSAEVTENAPLDHQLVVVKATDADIGLNGKVIYSLSDVTRQRYGGMFAVDADTGVVSQRSPINFEEYGDEIVLEVVARDVAGLGGVSSTQATALVTITVRDVNDNEPTIRVEIESDSDHSGDGRLDSGPVVLRIDEHVPANQVLAVVSVEDLDSGNAGKVRCSMPSSHFELKQIENYEKEFQISTGPGEIDRELQSQHRLVIKCNDLGNPVRSSSAIIEVIVNDINDNNPQFSETIYGWTVVENQPSGSVIGRVTATDQDVGANGQVEYRLESSIDHSFVLAINATTGEISTSSTFDREVSPTVRVFILAVDGGSMSRTGTATVDIMVADVDDETPAFTNEWFAFHVLENSPADTEVGRPTAVDRDSTPSFNEMSYYLDTTSSLDDVTGDIGRLFRVDPETGVIYTRRPLDRETRSVYNMTVAVMSVTSSHRSADLCHVVVNVGDVNDCPPVITYPSAAGNDTIRISSPSADGGGGPLAVVVATDADVGDNAKLSYNIAGWKYMRSEISSPRNDEVQRWQDGTNQFFINPVTGWIYVSRIDILEGKATKLLITAEDGGQPPLTSSAMLTVIVDGIQIRESYVSTFLSQPLGGVSLAVVIAGFAGLLVLLSLMTVATLVARRNRKRGRRTKHSHCSSFDGHLANAGNAGAEPLWSQDPHMSPTESITSSLQRCAILDVGDALTDSDEVTNGELLIMEAADDRYVRSRSGTMTSYEDAVRRAANQTQVYSSRDQLNMIGVTSTRATPYSPSILMTSQPSPKFSSFANWPTPSPTHSNSGVGSRFGTLERRTVRFKEDIARQSSELAEADTADRNGGESFPGTLPPPPPPLAIDTFGDNISYTSPYRLPTFPSSSHV